jgi:5'-methylthioadenosine phosphorylase
MVTDYDSWHPEHDMVDVASVIRVLNANRDRVQRLVARLAHDFPEEHEACPVGSDRALDHAIMTAPDVRDAALVKKLDAIAGRVLGQT